MSEVLDELENEGKEAQAEAEVESPAESEAEPGLVSGPDSEAEFEQEPGLELEPEGQPEAEAEAEPEPEDELEQEPETELEDEPEVEAAEASDAEQNGIEPAQEEEEVADKPSEKREGAVSTADWVVISIVALVLGVLLCLPTFLGSSKSSEGTYDVSGGVATIVNGVEIGENDVSAYINSFRTTQGLEDDEDWGQWMVDNGYTPEMLRTDTIEYFTMRELIAQAIKERGIEVSEGDIDAQIANVAEQLGGEEALSKALEAQSVSMGDYRESVALSLQQEALIDEVTAGDESVSDDAVLEMVKAYFPDQVPEGTDSLDGLDSSLVENMRTMLKQQAFSEWMVKDSEEASVTVNEMP